MPCPRNTFLLTLALAGILPAWADTSLRVVNGPETGTTWYLFPTTQSDGATFRQARPRQALGDSLPILSPALFVLEPGGQVEFRAAGAPGAAPVLNFSLMCWKPAARLELSEAPDGPMLQALSQVGRWDPAARTLALGTPPARPEPKSPAPLSIAVLTGRLSPGKAPRPKPAIPWPIPPAGPGTGAPALPQASAGAGAGGGADSWNPATRSLSLGVLPPPPGPGAAILSAAASPAVAAAPAGSTGPAKSAGPLGGAEAQPGGKRKPGPFDPMDEPKAKRPRVTGGAGAGAGAGTGTQAVPTEKHEPDASEPGLLATQVIRNQDPWRTWKLLLIDPDQELEVRRQLPPRDRFASLPEPSLEVLPAGEAQETDLETGSTLQLRTPIGKAETTLTFALHCAAMQDFAKQSLAFRWTFGPGVNRVESAWPASAPAGNPWEQHLRMASDGLVITSGPQESLSYRLPAGAGPALPMDGDVLGICQPGNGWF